MDGTTYRHVIPTEMKWSGGIFLSSRFYLTQVIFATWEDSSTRIRSLGMTCRDVVPFNHTGYTRNVAGGRLPPLRTHWWVVPFNRTGCIRGVVMAMNHRRYIAWFHSPAQVVFATWRAADCRPYRHTGGWYHSTTWGGIAASPERQRPFPTVSREGSPFAPTVSTMFHAVPHSPREAFVPCRAGITASG